jgi:signal transduction histidine kinase
MNRPWHTWSIFGICLAVLLAAMGWVSLTAVRLDRAQEETAQQAEVEERVRLALWRMDSALAALVIEESARPYYAYRSFHATERAYTKGYASIKQGDVLVPSTLLTYSPTNVLVHFQLNEDGRLTSPQVPLGNERVLAENSYVSREKIEAASSRLSQLQKILDQQAAPEPEPMTSSLSRSSSYLAPTRKPLKNGDLLIDVCSTVPTNPVNADIAAARQPTQQQERQNPQSQMLRNSAEWNARANASQQQAAPNEPPQNYIAPAELNLSEGPLKPVWLGPALVLARRVAVNGRILIQGCWLDWEQLRTSLLGNVRDLFPAANLQPVSALSGENTDPRRLAALPARLITGPVEGQPIPFWSPIRFSLVIAWACVLLAAIAVGVLLNGAVSLSERRGAFVSAVTHELRTPLTTFKMYSEMLAEGMVPDEEKRRRYLTTLCSEANRLSHLVENVLAYARLERGSARGRVEKVTVQTLIERVKPRLVERAEQAGMKLVVEASDHALQRVVHLDVSAVEQILFNLVDNACKYAAPNASEKMIHLEASPKGKFAMLRVRDHGQGLTHEAARRLFQPFSKSAHEAAHTAPGVGLGLALCRRLSRSMGGDLRLDPLVRDGACFVLMLPEG